MHLSFSNPPEKNVVGRKPKLLVQIKVMVFRVLENGSLLTFLFCCGLALSIFVNFFTDLQIQATEFLLKPETFFFLIWNESDQVFHNKVGF